MDRTEGAVDMSGEVQGCAPIASWWFMNVVGRYGSATFEKLTFDTFRQGEPVPSTFERGRDRGISALQ